MSLIIKGTYVVAKDIASCFEERMDMLQNALLIPERMCGSKL